MRQPCASPPLACLSFHVSRAGEPVLLSLLPRLGNWAVESTFISSLSDLPKGVSLSPPALRPSVPYRVRGRERERPDHTRMDSSEEREWGLQPGRRQGLAKWLEEADSSIFGQTQVGECNIPSRIPSRQSNP